LPDSTSPMVSVWPLRLPLDSGVTLLMGDLASFRLGWLDLLGPSVFAHRRATYVTNRMSRRALLMILVSYHLL
jgi:hypothetical protein